MSGCSLNRFAATFFILCVRLWGLCVFSCCFYCFNVIPLFFLRAHSRSYFASNYFNTYLHKSYCKYMNLHEIISAIVDFALVSLCVRVCHWLTSHKWYNISRRFSVSFSHPLSRSRQHLYGFDCALKRVSIKAFFIFWQTDSGYCSAPKKIIACWPTQLTAAIKRATEERKQR